MTIQNFKYAKYLVFSVLLFCLDVSKSTIVCAAGQKEYYVSRVIDGDTMELANGKKVRYIGINAPETTKKVGRDWDFDPEPYAVESKEFNKELVEGKKVSLEFDTEKEDNYGRWLAYVHAPDGTFVNLEMVRSGYALVYTFPPNDKYLSRFIENCEEARREARGLWQSLRPISPEDAPDNVGRVCSVKAKISAVYGTPKCVFLFFDGVDRSVFSALIYGKNIPLFLDGGIEISSLKGKTVEIIGKIKDDRSPKIIVDNPADLEVTD